MMLLHQHLKTAEWHSKHVSKLHRVDRILLCVEHSRLSLLNVLQLIDFGLVTTNSHCLDLTLGLLIFNVSFGVRLPLIVDLLVDETVGLLKDLTNVIVGSELSVHLHPDEVLHDADLRLKSVDLRPVGVFEVDGGQVDSWALGHQIDDDLDKSLLLKHVTSVLIALNVLEAEAQLGTLVLLLPLEYLLDNGKSINAR